MRKETPSIGSGSKNASALIYTGKCFLAAVIINTDGSNDAVVTVYDNTEGSGTVAYKNTVTGSENHGGIVYKFAKRCDTGIYVTVSGTGATYIVDYIPQSLWYGKE